MSLGSRGRTKIYSRRRQQPKRDELAKQVGEDGWRRNEGDHDRDRQDTHIRRQPHTCQIQRVVLQALHDARRGEELLEAGYVLEAGREVAGDGVEEGGEVAGDGVPERCRERHPKLRRAAMEAAENGLSGTLLYNVGCSECY